MSDELPHWKPVPGKPGAFELGRELPAEAYPPWPWKELDELSERLYHFMRGAVGQVLLAAGEDPRNKELFALRCVQVADGIRSRAERAQKEPS